MSLETVKCPYCGFVYRIDIERIFKDGQTHRCQRPQAGGSQACGRCISLSELP